MSTSKTVILTTAVLLLGSVLSLAGCTLWSQQQSINELTARVYILDHQIALTQKQADNNDARLSKIIKTSNHNFSSMSDREDDLEHAISLIAKFLSSAPDSDKDRDNPTNFTRSNHGS